MKKIILSITTILIFIPQIVSAVWWNPFTWFTNDKPIEVDIMNSDFSPEEETIQIETVTEQKTVIKEVEVPVEKIIEKTVTIQDQTIISENIEMKKRINELERIVKEKEIENVTNIIEMEKQFKLEIEKTISDSIKKGEENQKNRERIFFEELIINSDSSGDSGTRLCNHWTTNLKLDTLDGVCAIWRLKNFP